MWNNEYEYEQSTFFDTLPPKTLFMIDGFAGIYRKTKNGAGGKGVTIDAQPYIQVFPDETVFIRIK